MPTITPPELMEKIAERIQELERDIQKLAWRWSRDCPNDCDDLAQEVRLAIYHKLVEAPDSPRTHLFREAKQAILDYRRKGKSVDGRLHRGFRRQVVWRLVSLDEPDVVPAEYSGLYFRPHQLRPVEDLALAKVAFETMMERLNEQQGQYLSLMLQGHNGLEVNALMGLTQWGGERLRKEVKLQAEDNMRPARAPTPPGPPRSARPPAPAAPADRAQENLF